MVSATGLGYFRTIALQEAAANGVTYPAAFQRIEQLKQTLGEGEKILIIEWASARSAVVFDKPPWHLRSGLVHWSEAEKKLGLKMRYFVALQFSDNKHTPPKGANWKLIEDKFNSTPVKILGLPIRATTPGYGYAIYERL